MPVSSPVLPAKAHQGSVFVRQAGKLRHKLSALLEPGERPETIGELN